MNFPMHKTKAFSAPDDEDKIPYGFRRSKLAYRFTQGIGQ